MNNPYQQLALEGWSQLAELGWLRLKDNPHGDFSGWLESIAKLPTGDGFNDLEHGAPKLGRPAEDLSELRAQLFKLHPWRKGPLEMGGVRIDTEWCSDWKWDRIKPGLNINGHNILDIGSGNGYFGLRMLAAGARLVVGVDPTMVFVMQWLAMQKLCPGLNNFVLPLGIEDLPADTGCFDTVFSMGVLYHRREPVEHLEQLKALSCPGGQIVLETLILDGEDASVLKPTGRYARMRNVHAIPTLSVLHEWLAQAGMRDVKVLDVSRTTVEEQRSTEWMTFESLQECLDPGNPLKSIEGYPAPVRAALLIKL